MRRWPSRSGWGRRRCAGGSCRPRSTPVSVPGVTSEEHEEIKRLKAKNRRLRGGQRDPARRPRFSSRGNSTPATADHGVHRRACEPRGTRSSRSAGSCVSRAARSPRGPTGPGSSQPAGRRPDGQRRAWWSTRSATWPGRSTRDGRAQADPGRALRAAEDDRARAPHRLPGRLAGAAWTGRCALLGLYGVRRDKGVRTTIPAKDGKRAGDLLDRDFTAAGAEPGLGHRLHLRPHLGRVRLRRVHPRRVRPADRGLARRDDQGRPTW